MSLFTIEYNENYQNKADANIFLLYDGDCVGGADKQHNGKWVVDVNAEWDGETDVYRIGEFDTQADAHIALWENRNLAYINAT